MDPNDTPLSSSAPVPITIPSPILKSDLGKSLPKSILRTTGSQSQPRSPKKPNSLGSLSWKADHEIRQIFPINSLKEHRQNLLPPPNDARLATLNISLSVLKEFVDIMNDSTSQQSVGPNIRVIMVDYYNSSYTKATSYLDEMRRVNSILRHSKSDDELSQVKQIESSALNKFGNSLFIGLTDVLAIIRDSPSNRAFGTNTDNLNHLAFSGTCVQMFFADLEADLFRQGADILLKSFFTGPTAAFITTSSAMFRIPGDDDNFGRGVMAKTRFTKEMYIKAATTQLTGASANNVMSMGILPGLWGQKPYEILYDFQRSLDGLLASLHAQVMTDWRILNELMKTKLEEQLSVVLQGHRREWVDFLGAEQEGLPTLTSNTRKNGRTSISSSWNRDKTSENYDDDNNNDDDDDDDQVTSEEGMFQIDNENVSRGYGTILAQVDPEEFAKRGMELAEGIMRYIDPEDGQQYMERLLIRSLQRTVKAVAYEFHLKEEYGAQALSKRTPPGELARGAEYFYNPDAFLSYSSNLIMGTEFQIDLNDIEYANQKLYNATRFELPQFEGQHEHIKKTLQDVWALHVSKTMFEMTGALAFQLSNFVAEENMRLLLAEHMGEVKDTTKPFASVFKRHLNIMAKAAFYKTFWVWLMERMAREVGELNGI